MIFIGSREYLGYVSSDFKDVWISLVRDFNRFPRRKLDTNKVKECIKLLKEKVGILLGEAIKKDKSMGSGENVAERENLAKTKLDLAGLIAALESLSHQLDLSSDLPSTNSLVSYKQILPKLALIQLKMKEVKNLINVFAVSYVRSTRRGFLKETISFTKEAVIVLLAIGALTQTLQQGLVFLAKDLPVKKDGLAILISYELGNTPEMVGVLQKLFIPAYVARVELAFGQKANLVKKAATKKDFFTTIRDDSIQNIVIFGHGSWGSWVATDGVVNSDRLYQEIARKKGLLVRHTCGRGQDRFDEEFFYLSPENRGKLNNLIEKYNQKIVPWTIRIETSLEAWMDNIPRDYYYNIGIYSKVNGSGTGQRLYQGFGIGFNRSDEFKNFKGILKKNLGSYYQDSEELDNIIKIGEDILKTKKIFQSEGEPLLGLPVFKRENIKGWNRTASGIDFIINVFGQVDTKRDQLYAKG